MFLSETKLIREAKKSKHLYNVPIGYLLIFLFLIVGELVGEVVFHIIKSVLNISSSSPIYFSISLITQFLFCTLAVFIWVKKYEKRQITGMGFSTDKFTKKYILGFIVGVILFSLVVLLLTVTDHINLVSGINTSSIIGLLVVLPAWMIQGATEEILVRGWLMNVLGAKYNSTTIGVIFSSLLFAILHLLNPNASLVAFLNLFITGILFGLYVIKTKNLWGACGLHTAWNFFQGNIFGFEVSGLQPGGGSLMKLKLVGSKLFTGGSFGPEAGFASTIVLCITIIILFYMIKKNYDN